MTDRRPCPNLQPVIDWLERGCDPIEAAKELRIYQAMHRESDPGATAKAETLAGRMLRVAADMRETARLLDALGTELDSKPGGYQRAYHCIHRARELDGASRMLESWAQEVGA
jgi:ribosomal protein L17